MEDLSSQIMALTYELQQLEAEYSTVNTTIERDTIKSQIDSIRREIYQLQMRQN